jgi:TetR/AcrR family transcriptional regulator, transcriptional repressor for nem operon
MANRQAEPDTGEPDTGQRGLAEPGSAERLLDAADRLMYARGYHDVGVAELCREADVRPGSFYYHFDSKESLAAAMLERAWERTRTTIFADAFTDGVTDPVDAVARYAAALEQHLIRVRDTAGIVVGCRFGNFAIETAPHQDRVGEVTRGVLDAIAEQFTAAIERGRRDGHVDHGVDPVLTGRLLLAQMEGLMVLAKANRDPSLIRLLEPAARRLLRSPTLEPAPDDRPVSAD